MCERAELRWVGLSTRRLTKAISEAQRLPGEVNDSAFVVVVVVFQLPPEGLECRGLEEPPEYPLLLH